MKPSAIPFETEYVKGIEIIATNAGITSVKSSHCILTMFDNIITPTIINAAVAAEGTIAIIGWKNKERKIKLKPLYPLNLSYHQLIPLRQTQHM